MHEQFEAPKVWKLDETHAWPYLTIPKITSCDIIFDNYTDCLNNTNTISFCNETSTSASIKLKRKSLLLDDVPIKKEPVKLQANISIYQNTRSANNPLEHTQTNLNENVKSLCEKEIIKFRKPLLNCKRPPSRKRNRHKVHVQTDLDTISLFTSSDFSCDIRTGKCLLEDPHRNLTNIESKKEDTAVITSTHFVDYKIDENPEKLTSQIENNIKSLNVKITSSQNIVSNESKNESNTPLPCITSKMQTNLRRVKRNVVKRWLGIGSAQCNVRKSYLKKKYLNFCKIYAHGNECMKASCHFMHSIPTNIQDEFNILSMNETTYAFQQILGKKMLFPVLFPFVVQKYEKLKATNLLVQMIDDILASELLDKTPFINLILEALIKNLGSVRQAINVITKNFGIGKTVLCDILLSLVVGREDSVRNHWDVIYRFTNMNNNVDHGVIGDIMEKCSETPLDKQLFEPVSKHLLQHLASVKLVSPEILLKFTNNLIKVNLHKYASIFMQVTGSHTSLGSEIEKENTDTSSGISSQLQENESLLETPFKHDKFKNVDSVELKQETGVSNMIRSMSESDCINLAQLVFEKEIVGYVDLLLEYNKHDALKECFVLNSIAVFKNCNTDVYDMFTKVYNYIDNLHLKNKCESILELLALNILFLLSDNLDFDSAGRIAAKFMNNIDQFLNRKIFDSRYKLYLSDDHTKYLFLIKIFTRSHNIKEAYQLFIKKDWDEAIYKCGFGKDFFNKITEFITTTIEINELHIAKDIILYIISNTLLHEEFDIWNHLNTLIIRMLSESQCYKVDLLYMTENIITCWAQHLKKDVLRGLLLVLFDDLSLGQKADIYQICSEMGIYHYIEGNESKITIFKNMYPQEIYLVFYLFLKNMQDKNYNPHDVLIYIDGEINVEIQLAALRMSNSTINHVTNMVVQVFKCYFKVNLIVDNINNAFVLPQKIIIESLRTLRYGKVLN